MCKHTQSRDHTHKHTHIVPCTHTCSLAQALAHARTHPPTLLPSSPPSLPLHQAPTVSRGRQRQRRHALTKTSRSSLRQSFRTCACLHLPAPASQAGGLRGQGVGRRAYGVGWRNGLGSVIGLGFRVQECLLWPQIPVAPDIYRVRIHPCIHTYMHANIPASMPPKMHAYMP